MIRKTEVERQHSILKCIRNNTTIQQNKLMRKTQISNPLFKKAIAILLLNGLIIETKTDRVRYHLSKRGYFLLQHIQ